MTGQQHPYDWDAATYDALPLPHLAWGQNVLERLDARDGETVLDIGCGTGRDLGKLLRTVPGVRAVAIDGSHDMLRQCRERLEDFTDRTEVAWADLRKPLPDDYQADAAMSVATFHWISDHEQLFTGIARNLRHGGRLVAEAGGEGNIAAVRAVLRSMGVADGGSKWNFVGVKETSERLVAAGFRDVNVRLFPDPTPLRSGQQLETYLRTVVLGPDLAEMAPEDRDPFVSEVARNLPNATVDYVRVRIDAVRA